MTEDASPSVNLYQPCRLCGEACVRHGEDIAEPCWGEVTITYGEWIFDSFAPHACEGHFESVESGSPYAPAGTTSDP